MGHSSPDATSHGAKESKSTSPEAQPKFYISRSAQTALLVAVIKATPTEVMYSVAKDIISTSCRTAADFCIQSVQSLPVISHYSKGTSVATDALKLDVRRQKEVEKKSTATQTTPVPKPWFSSASPLSLITSNPAAPKSKEDMSQLQQSNPDAYDIIKSLVKIIVKLFLNFLLEIITLSLKVMG